MKEFNLNLELLRENDFNDDACDAFIFLEELRQSGVTNMFGALPYLKKEYDHINEKELKKILEFYFKNYNDIYIFED